MSTRESARPRPGLDRHDGLAVLVLAPTGRDAHLSCETIERAGLACVACQSADDLMRRIDAGSGPVVIASEAIGAADVRTLCDRLDEQPEWSDLPVIVIAPTHSIADRIATLTDRRSGTLLQRPIDMPTFVTTVRTAVEDRRRQYALRDSLLSLQQRAEQLVRLSLKLSQAEEGERRRISAILHDDLQQILVGAKMHVDMLPGFGHGTDEYAQALAALGELLGQAIEKSRLLSHELSPPQLKTEGLAAALRALADRTHRLHGLTVDLEASSDAEPSDKSHRTFAYRAAQELLFNVVKHAGVERASMRLVRTERGVELTVRDAGCGFDPDGEQADSPGLGLAGIGERAQLMGARLIIESAPGQGSSFTLVLP
jgi:signal transduction histidine kinase